MAIRDRRLMYPIPAAVPRSSVEAAMRLLGLDPAVHAGRLRTVTIGWAGLRVEIYAEGPNGRSLPNIADSGMALDVVTVAVVDDPAGED